MELDPVLAPKRKRGRPKRGEETHLTEERKSGTKKRRLYREGCWTDEKKLEYYNTLRLQIETKNKS